MERAMFGLGFGEIVIILVLALILLGPKRLPDVAKQLGKALRDFKRATEDLKDQFETELYNEPARPPPRLTEPPKVPGPPQGTVPVNPAPAALTENAPGPEMAPPEPDPNRLQADPVKPA
jgi:Tat protein translocase TatB subunit